MSEIIQPSSEGTPSVTLPQALRKPRLRRWEATEYLRLMHGIEVAPATLAKWASISGGPGYLVFPLVDLLDQQGTQFIFATGSGSSVLPEHYSGFIICEITSQLEAIVNALSRLIATIIDGCQ